jgi:hypothetical protein
MLFVLERRRSRFLCVCQAAVWPVVESGVAGSGSDLSEELVLGVEPAALDCTVAPWCPPGPAASCRSSRIMSRQMWSARRRFRQPLVCLANLDDQVTGKLLAGRLDRPGWPNAGKQPGGDRGG